MSVRTRRVLSSLVFLFCLVQISVLATTAQARPPIRRAFFNDFPSATNTRLDELVSNANHCGVCHLDFDGGGPRNNFGLAVEVAINSGNYPDFESAILSVVGLDSDGDGYSSNVEITATTLYNNTPTFPGLKASNLAAVSNVDVTEIQDYLTPSGSSDTTPPAVLVIAPNGGEALTPDTTYTVSWTATDASGVERVELQLSDDGGSTFHPVSPALPPTGSYEWFVPNLPGTANRMRVVAVDSASNPGSDDSDGDFTIDTYVGGTAPTTLRDFEMAGTQPFSGTVLDDPSVTCITCHANYDDVVEPWHLWQGSMMAHAMRDPLYLATLSIANQDAPGVGDMCLRCHTPGGWMEGRSTDPTGGMITAKDRQGVQCDFCHRLVDPDYTPGVSPTEDQDVLAALDEIPLTTANGQFVTDPSPLRRGPYADAQASHEFVESPFHRSSDICGTCHDVSNPVFVSDGTLGGYNVDTLDSAHPDGDLRNMFPVERTFSEWTLTDYANGGVYAPQFAGDKPDGIVSTCQDCHMADVTGAGANVPGSPTRSDLPAHDLTGGNTFVPSLLPGMWGAEVDSVALEDGRVRATGMLQKAATLGLSNSVVSGHPVALVTVTNETAHKLPSGYPEGRRIWITLRAYDGSDVLVYESGHYDGSTGVLTQDEDLTIYHSEPGISTHLGTALGLPPGPSFHFALNDSIYFDNRIPPRGFTNAAFEAIQAQPIGHAYADGQYSDTASYDLPSTARRIEVELYYQTTSKEYVEFLRDENVTDDNGQDMYDMWVAHGRAAPVLMASAALSLDVTATDDVPVAYVTDLKAAVPNPFNPKTTLTFSLSSEQRASLRIMDVRGRLVAVLADGRIPAGEYQSSWNGRDRAGHSVASGVYYAVLQSEEGTITQKLALVR